MHMGDNPRVLGDIRLHCNRLWCVNCGEFRPVKLKEDSIFQSLKCVKCCEVIARVERTKE